jgi:FlaG/FlaF family flagellin (archaellin)
MEKEKKIFCGSGKKQNEKWLKASLNFDEISKHVEEYMGKKYVKVNINITDPNKYGKTVEITIDTWKPTSNEPTNRPVAVAKDVSDLPF